MRRAWIIAGLIAALAALGPIFAPTDPLTSVDPVALRLLPPLTRVPALETTGGRVLPIAGRDPGDPSTVLHDVRVEGQAVLYRRGPRLRRVPLSELRVDEGGRPLVSTLHFVAGTDRYGRDLLSRLLSGARASLAIGVMATIVAAIIGSAMGLLSGLSGRFIDIVIARLSDTVLAAPRIVLIMVVAALVDTGPWGLAVLIGATGWPLFTRLVRAETRSLAASEMILASRASGSSVWRLAFRHAAPHAAAVVLVAAGLRLGPFILLEASLSFLGFGVTPPDPSWGNILADGRDVLFEAWWVATLPGLLLGATVLLANAVADRMRRSFSRSE